MDRKRVILYFGSFNPVHNGHTAIVSYLLECGMCEQVWMVVSPHNPLKECSVLASEQARANMLSLSIIEVFGIDSRVEICKIEFDMPKPSYTINTLRELWEKYPDIDFSIIMGEDNIAELHLWRNFSEILSSMKIFVYPRDGVVVDNGLDKYPNVMIMNNAPRFDVSSTSIREMISQKNDLSRYLCSSVAKYIKENSIYERE